MLNFFTTSNGFRSTLPVVSNLTAMNVWDGVCMCFIYASLLEFVCVNYVGRKRPLHNVVYRPGENPVTQVGQWQVCLLYFHTLIETSFDFFILNIPLNWETIKNCYFTFSFWLQSPLLQSVESTFSNLCVAFWILKWEAELWETFL